MTQVILITGLDGSGKSTLFSKIESANLKHVKLISALHEDIEAIPDSSPLKKPVTLLKELSEEAIANDRNDLKAMALFSAMVMFSKMVQEKSTSDTKYILCERHPMIDTFVYAKFYLPRLGGGNASLEDLFYYANKYDGLFSYILDILPIDEKELGVYSIYRFIKTYFKGKDFPDAETARIFDIDVPDKIFFLKAPPEVLMERISTREVQQAHEKLSILSDLEVAYDTLFEKIASDGKAVVENIDASSFDSLDAFYTQLLNEISS